MEHLTRAQRRALDYVVERALRAQSAARAELAAAMDAGGVPESVYAGALENLRSHGRVVLAFHPERSTRTARSVAQGLLAEGVYRSQFETGLSSGSTTAFPGGERDEWERRLFGGAYHAPGLHDADRPKYGALFLVGHPDGPCPRFGSSYFVLRPEVSQRCSFTLLGSQEESAPDQTGTLAVPEPWLAPLARHLESFPTPLGVRGLSFSGLIKGMSREVPIAREQKVSIAREQEVGDHHGRALDTFVEAQVHGPVSLARDVEAVVVDASFSHTSVGATLLELSSTYDIPLRWHPALRFGPTSSPRRFGDSRPGASPSVSRWAAWWMLRHWAWGMMISRRTQGPGQSWAPGPMFSLPFGACSIISFCSAAHLRIGEVTRRAEGRRTRDAAVGIAT